MQRKRLFLRNEIIKNKEFGISTLLLDGFLFSYLDLQSQTNSKCICFKLHLL
ncbi:uncharacterized protein ASCRUDRAFT_73158 [Ascoidea rubescens DSM 1968]|uniref:Uncharacterized protein n=1 Tax=Ascoidea rubescens DSM 1968 TaxID=1344418 RepID=A0A1D2VNS6_9ASCO|nr:hypothetical protein ASCRUDRAFT_73158 [Ascoidea rubescens DSM 1968]ODV63260.1 hypothetical protein ASCRUDRAFT_73158 [Ascoidea rubescens DSM 1968]